MYKGNKTKLKNNNKIYFGFKLRLNYISNKCIYFNMGFFFKEL